MYLASLNIVNNNNNKFSKLVYKRFSLGHNTFLTLACGHLYPLLR